VSNPIAVALSFPLTSFSQRRSHSEFTELLGAINEASSDLIEQWNALNSSLLPELLTMCFSYLDFKSRVTVTKVSRLWRRAALRPALWATTRIQTAADAKWVSRQTLPSIALDLQLHWTERDLQGFVDAMENSLARVRSLTVTHLADCAWWY
jgi:hypothetical protein